jgi:autoinducer 2 (AI-2) kinase
LQYYLIQQDISKAANELVHLDKAYEPNMENHALYENLYKKWCKVYGAQLELCNQKLTNNMWIAPGL